MPLETTAQNEPKRGFLDLGPEDYRALIASWGQPKFRADQVVSWIFEKRASSPEQMTNVPAALKLKLNDALTWTMPPVRSALTSEDGATKLLLVSGHGQFIESVILRYEGRTSLCVSSQVGCKLACSFCQTGKLGFFRNLSAHEILAQYFLACDIVKDEGRRISHLVFMGMGEPLDNYNHVVRAVKSLTGPEGFGLSGRHVTVSTSGIVPKIPSLADDARAALAVSLHACRDSLRSELMPINRKYPLADLKAALMEYQRKSGDKITIEYILIKGKNCGLNEAKDLVKFIHGLRAKVNLIPFNAHPGLPFERPDEDEIRLFQQYLSERSIPAPVRYSRGLDVSGGCGQLAAKETEALHDAPRRKSVVVGPHEPEAMV